VGLCVLGVVGRFRRVSVHAVLLRSAVVAQGIAAAATDGRVEGGRSTKYSNNTCTARTKAAQLLLACACRGDVLLSRHKHAPA